MSITRDGSITLSSVMLFGRYPQAYFPQLCITAMEVIELTENRYSGIPTIRRVMKEAGLKEPVFKDERGTFTVILGIGTVSYAMQTYITPLIEKGLVELTIPERPRSQSQKYVRSGRFDRITYRGRIAD